MTTSLCNWFFLFALFIGPVLCIVAMIIIGLINSFKRKYTENVEQRSVKQWRENNLRAQHEMRKDSGWYVYDDKHKKR